jgi:hypothetical protein
VRNKSNRPKRATTRRLRREGTGAISEKRRREPAWVPGPPPHAHPENVVTPSGEADTRWHASTVSRVVNREQEKDRART